MPVRRVIAVLASVIGLLAGAIALPATAAAAPGDTTIVNCRGNQVVKPKQIVITCADAQISIVKITWTSWTANEARGRGTLAWNTCLPTDCADGIVQTYRARITLGGVASGPDGTVFSQVRLAFPNGGGPAGLYTGSYTIDNPIS